MKTDTSVESDKAFTRGKLNTGLKISPQNTGYPQEVEVI